MNYFKTIILFCMAIMSLETYSQIPQTNNLISYYPFLGNLEDQSGKNHNTGSINGDPSLTQNRFGTNNAAYYLDGTDDYLYFGNSIYADLPDTDSDGYYEDDYTISLWAKSSVVDNEIFIAFGEADDLYTYENNAANDFSLPPITPFVTTWQTDGSNNITIPLIGSGYDFTVDWGDGTTEIKTGAPGNISHTYSTAGVKTVSITPNITTGFPRIYVNNFGNRNLLQTIESWGSGYYFSTWIR